MDSFFYPSFKDFALQLFPQLFDYIYQHSPTFHTHPSTAPTTTETITTKERFAILVSTSGDTGSATIHGFSTKTNMPVIVLYPSDGVSPIQKVVICLHAVLLYLYQIEKYVVKNHPHPFLLSSFPFLLLSALL